MLSENVQGDRRKSVQKLKNFEKTSNSESQKECKIMECSGDILFRL